MTVQDIMDRVSLLYNDVDYERTSQDMYLRFLDQALLQLVLARPDCHVYTDVIQLDPGTRQELPTEALNLIEIYRNRGDDGLEEGAPVWQVNRKDMDYFSNWHGTPTTEPTEITEYAYDVKSPRTFWVSPPPGATVPIYIEMDYSYGFTQYQPLGWDTAVTQVVDVDDTFLSPICNFMLFLLYSTDTASQTDRTVAEAYKQAFYTDLGLEYKAATLNAPVPGDTIIVNAQEGN